MSPVFSLNVEGIESLFKSALPDGVIYTKVPRGLIMSIDEKNFFNDCDTCIKGSSLGMLDSIANILKSIPNYCVIENHSQNELCSEDLEQWEISSVRSSNIAEYLIKAQGVEPDKIFDIGFGETMPFRENVTPNKKGFDNRIDFVIIEYEAKR